MLRLKCPASVEGDWQIVVTSVFKGRVAHLTEEACVKLLCELLENNANTPDLVTDNFTTEASEALDELVFKVSAWCFIHNIIIFHIAVHVVFAFLFSQLPNRD